MASQEKLNEVKAYLDMYFTVQVRMARLNAELDLIEEEYTSLSSPQFEKIGTSGGLPMTDERVLRMIEKKDLKMARINECYDQLQIIKNAIPVQIMSELEYKLVQYVHRDKKSYTEIGTIVGYTKQQVYNIMRNIYERMAAYL